MLRLFHRNIFKQSRFFHPNIDLGTSGSTFRASQMSKHLRSELLSLPNYQDPKGITFGQIHTDHMITVDHDVKNGWHHPKLTPFQDLHLNPFISGFHYGIQCYEGLKAYKNEKGQVRLFRPDCNAYRMKRSSMRVTMPDFDGNEFVKLIEEFVRLEERWIPSKPNHALYIRPFMFGTDEALGVKKPDKSRLMIVASPIGPYFSTGFKPISLYCPRNLIRIAPKSTGAFKVGGNYAPSIRAKVEADSKGHQQVLWLWQGKVLESGSTNIFFVFKNKNGEIEVVTPELEDMVLPGITRDSLIEIMKDEKEFKVVQRKIFIDEVIERQKKGELLQAFGTGTAVLVSSIKNIEFQGVNYAIPFDEKLNFGKIAYRLRQKLSDIQQGYVEDKFGWVKRIK